MSINKKFMEKYDAAYAGIPATVPAVYSPDFDPVYGPKDEWWLDISPMYIPGVIPGAYSISNYGRIRRNKSTLNYPNGQILSANRNGHGYYQINLQGTNGQKIGCKVARLVLLHFAFVPGCQYFEVDHINGDKSNNSIWNLEWVTPQENIHRAIANGLRPVSCTVQSVDHFLTNEEAYAFYEEAYPNMGDPDKLGAIIRKYGISVQLGINILKGICRPYIAKRYEYDHHHIDSLNNVK